MLLAIMAIVIVVSIPIAVMLAAHLIQHYAKDIRTGVNELILYISCHLHLDFAAVDNHDQAIHQTAQDQSISNRKHRRRVDEHVIVLFLCTLQNVLHALAAQQLARIRRNYAGRQCVEALDTSCLHSISNCCTHADAARKANLIGQIEVLMYSRITHIAVDKQHAFACLRKYNC